MRGPPIRAGKRDANEREIIDALEDYGCLVFQLNLIDLFVQTPRLKKQMLQEVKTEKGKLTKKQQELRKKGLVFIEVRTPEEAIAVVREADGG